jgi:hypothetical protein
MKIRYITPFSFEKNIGKALNESIEELPDDCFVVCRDGDTLFMLPDWGMQIKEIIEANPDYHIIGCMTNRLSVPQQLAPGMFDESDIGKHIETAQTLQQYRTEVVKSNIAAGLCMIFHKSVWQKCKFKENTVIFDRIFCIEASKNGFNIGIAKGLYLFHLYRWGKKNPEQYKDHLNPFL